MRTIVEHISQMSREEVIMWAKDIAAGAGLLAFVVCSFALATIAQAMAVV
jgi:diacylglycerol kinase